MEPKTVDSTRPASASFDRLSDEQQHLASLLLMACGHVAFLGELSVSRVEGRTTIIFVVDDNAVIIDDPDREDLPVHDARSITEVA